MVTCADSQPDDYPPTPTHVWDVRHVRMLLHAQTWKLDTAPWRMWIHAHGGIETVLTYLQTCPLSADYHALLVVILGDPGEQVPFYIARWRPMHRATFAEHFTKLCAALAHHLNSWGARELERVHLAESPVAPPRRPAFAQLPAQVTSFVGREAEVLLLEDVLIRRANRLVTLTGPGGTGKTRLALRIAETLGHHFPDGVFFVPLSTINDPAMVLPTIAEALQVKQNQRQSLLASLQEFLADQHVLGVLDNFEHVLDAAPGIAHLLHAARRLKLVVTSREKLHLYGEHEYIVSPLALPIAGERADLERLLQVPTITLFLDRAQSTKPRFMLTEDNADAITEICRTLDGLPLAIELAAAQSKYFSPSKILARLTDRFDALTHGPRNLPQRQQTLRAAIDWSYVLLNDAEQRLFRRLGVFLGGCTLEGVEVVCSTSDDRPMNLFDGLIALINKSLLQAHELGDEQRFFMLETIRAYAVEMLQAHGEEERSRVVHARYYVRLAAQAEHASHGRQQVVWYNRLEREHDNIRAALRWTLGNDQADIALRLSGSLWRFWFVRGYLSEGRQWLQRALDARHTSPDEVRVKVLDGSGVLAMFQGEYAVAVRYNEEALALYRRLEDRAGVSDILESIGVLHEFLNEYDRATEFYTESLAIRQTLGDLARISLSSSNLGRIAFMQGDYEQVQRYMEQSLTLSRKVDDNEGIATALCTLGTVSLIYHRAYRTAHTLYQECIGVIIETQHKDIMVNCLEGLALLALTVEDIDRAARLFHAIEKFRSTFGLVPNKSLQQDAFQQRVRQAYKHLGEVVWSLRRDEARAMTLDEVIHYGLDVQITAQLPLQSTAAPHQLDVPLGVDNT